MKELSIEEKAKRYDEAIDKAKKELDACGSQDCDAARQIFRFFPELKESRDERIRKNLIELFHDVVSNDEIFSDYGLDKTEVLAWLEKQKIDKEINLAKILKHYPKETELYSPLYGKLWLAEVDEKNEIITCYKHPLEEGCTRAILPQEDTVSFYSNGTTGLPDYTVSKDCMLFLYNIEKQVEQEPIDYNEELKKCRENPLYFFDKYVKVKLEEQKPAWSENDEYIIERLSYLLDNEQENYPQLSCDFQEIQEFKDWLKSLKQRIKL